MKRKNLLLVLMVLVLLLAACSGNSNSNASQDQTSAGDLGTRPAGAANDAVNINTLLVGSFMLEEAGYPITAEQAQALIPLWKLANSLLSSDTAAQEETQAALTSIAAQMTEDQLAAMQNLDPDAMMTLMTELGISLQPEGASSDGSADSAAGRGMGGGVPGSGMGPGAGGTGAVPGVTGGGSGTGTTTMTEEEIATLQAEREAGGGMGMRGFGNNTALIEALIEMLEEIAAAG